MGGIGNIEGILEKAAAEDRRQLYEHEVYEILTELQIKTPTYLVARGEKDITHSALPVFSTERIVIKVISSQVAHKQKAGGVKVVYKDLDFVTYSVREMRQRFEEQSIRRRGAFVSENRKGIGGNPCS